TAGMIAYVGDPASKRFLLPEGQYALAAVDEQGRIVTQDTITAEIGQPIHLPADFGAAGGVQDDAMASALKTLANFLCDAAEGQLIALQGLSAGFTTPMFDPSARPTQALLNQLNAWYADILSQQDAAMAALYLVQSKAAPPQAKFLPVGYSARPARAIPEFSLPFKSLRDKLVGFFGYAGDAGKRARQRILLVAATLTAAQRADAFSALREGFKGDSTTWDEFAKRLQSGELDQQALSIESDLRNFSQYGDAAQNANQGTGKLLVQEGSELLKRGAEFDAEVIKTVLGQVFPDITKGFDLADRADEWATYIRDVYKATVGLDPKAQREVIKTLIKDELSQCCRDIPPDAADQVATAISERAVDSIQQPNNAATGTSAPAETPTTAETETETPPATTEQTQMPLPGETATPTSTVTPTSPPTQQALAPGNWSWSLGTVSYAGSCSTGVSSLNATSVNFVEAPDRTSAQLAASGVKVSLSGDGTGNYQGQTQAVSINIHVSSPNQAAGQLVTTVLGCTVTAPFHMARSIKD
ncbi:MAG TPA: hypothetical protein VKQ72_22500, partial [Aggregatilineales bacterium]|nr:hypothetical protein [Aggregatilineales bacterium]